MAPTALTDLIAGLVAIDSVNPDLVPGAAGEGGAAAYAAAWMEGAGLEVEVVQVLRGRPNVIGRRRGRGGGRTLLLNGHLDTVGVAGMTDPHAPRIEGDRLYGRGSYDMKAGLAAAMVAAAAVDGLAGDVVVAAVMDEESQGRGTAALVETLRADGAVVVEPTEEVVGIAHKGFLGFRVQTAGVAAHGSRPDLGRDAILAMAPVLERLRDLGARLATEDAHPLLGHASLHASTISGGQEFSSYPASCELHGEIRTLPGRDFEPLLRELDPALEIEVRGIPLETPADDPVAACVLRHAGTELGGLSYWTDAATLSAAGIPSVLYGPCGAGAHAVEEWVDLASAHRVASVLEAVARDFCASRGA